MLNAVTCRHVGERRLGGPHSCSGCFGEVLCQELNPDSSVVELVV